MAAMQGSQRLKWRKQGRRDGEHEGSETGEVVCLGALFILESAPVSSILYIYFIQNPRKENDGDQN